MNTRELQENTGMSRTNIRFYESEQLLKPPARGSEYDTDDARTLQRIKLLRLLGLEISEIRSLQSGEAGLTALISRQMDGYPTVMRARELYQGVCEGILASRVSYEQLEPQVYLRVLDVPLGNWGNPLQRDALPYTPHPWRRYFARMLDYTIYGLIFYFVCYFVIHQPLRDNLGLDFLLMISTLGLSFLLEPLLLSLLATTPGKWIFGITVRRMDGQNLTFGEAVSRRFQVLRYGEGFDIPIYSLYRLVKSSSACTEDQLPWDGDTSYCFKDTKPWRIFAFVGANVVTFFLVILILLNTILPPNRGQLTTAEFAENYNYYAESVYGTGFQGLTPTLAWEGDDPTGTGVVWVYFNNDAGLFSAVEEDGQLRQLVYTRSLSSEDSDPPLYIGSDQPLLAILAAVGAQRDVGLFSNFQRKLVEALEGDFFNSHTLTYAGVTVEQQIFHEGLKDGGSYLHSSDNEPWSLEQTVTITLP